MSEICQKIFPDETIADVQQTWSLINSNLEVVGVEVLLRYKIFPHFFFFFLNRLIPTVNCLKNKLIIYIK